MIRAYHQQDFPRLLAIENATQAFPWSETIFRQCLIIAKHCDVVEVGDQIVGFIVSSLQLGECHILNFAVDPAHQRQGLGEALIIHALKKMKKQGAGFAYLEVRKHNLPAIALYRKMGFVEISIRKDYYPAKNGHEDAVVFAMDLGINDAL